MPGKMAQIDWNLNNHYKCCICFLLFAKYFFIHIFYTSVAYVQLSLES